jgi:hypothetical protein
VTETPEQRVARLERELAEAKVTALQKELDEARGAAAPQGAYPMPSFTKPPPHLTGTPVHLASTQTSTSTPTGMSTWLPDSAGGWGVDRDQPQQGDRRLASAPRPVPSVFKVVVFPFSFWTLFALFMVSISPIALWIAIPISAAIAAALTFLVIASWTLRRTHLRNLLLKWGDVATVTNVDLVSRGTYYSGTTYQNVRLAQAHGWRVERQWYSGPATKTGIDYQVGSGKGSLVLRGLPYDNGVILADPRKPARALCVSSFPYDLERDENGNWVGHVSARVLILSLIMTVIIVGWTAGMIYLSVKQARS